MPFTVIEKVFRGSARRGLYISVGARAHCGRLLVEIVISSDLLESLGWQNDTLVQVALGGGEDAGLLRLQPNSAGFKLSPNGRKARATSYVVRFRLSGPTERRTRERCDYTISEDALFVTLPSWAATSADIAAE